MLTVRYHLQRFLRAPKAGRIYFDTIRARRLLKSHSVQAMTIDEVIDLAMTFRVGCIAIAPVQSRSEVREMMKIVKIEQPRIILEIGTAQGGTLFLFAHVAASDATLITVDLLGGRGGFLGRWSPLGILCRAFAIRSQTIWTLFPRDSHDRGTLHVVQRILAQRPVDVLFIDGDHSYEGVSRDFAMYGPLVRPNGLIIFHDIVSGSPAFVGGVPEFWNEVKTNHEAMEFVESPYQEGMGLGVLRV